MNCPFYLHLKCRFVKAFRFIITIKKL
jgi:hypothetical protein